MNKWFSHLRLATCEQMIFFSMALIWNNFISEPFHSDESLSEGEVPRSKRSKQPKLKVKLVKSTKASCAGNVALKYLCATYVICV